MDDNKIRQIVREEIQRNDNRGRFTLQSIPIHTHNGIDSKRIFQPTLTYIGLVASDGSAALLPQGWTSEESAGKTYTVTHNLGSQQGSSSNGFSALYSVVVQNQTLGVTVSPFVQEFENYFSVQWVNSVTATIDIGFSFILTIINNHSIQNQIYTGSLISQ